jgi:hypothetical protein
VQVLSSDPFIALEKWLRLTYGHGMDELSTVDPTRLKKTQGFDVSSSTCLSWTCSTLQLA